MTTKAKEVGVKQFTNTYQQHTVKPVPVYSEPRSASVLKDDLGFPLLLLLLGCDDEDEALFTLPAPEGPPIGPNWPAPTGLN